MASVQTARKLGYWIGRTKTGNLPIYTDIRNGRTRKLTVVRKYEGDIIVSY
jgi:hypothetical protein